MSRYAPPPEVARALDVVKAAGYVCLREGSYSQMRERHRVAEARLQWEHEANGHTRRWAEKAYDEQRRLADRLNEVVVLAMAKGVTADELWALQTTFNEESR